MGETKTGSLNLAIPFPSKFAPVCVHVYNEKQSSN